MSDKKYEDMTLSELKRDYGIDIDVSEAEEKDHKITLKISKMKSTNGETRIRLIFNDGTAYIKTILEGKEGGWQNAHYHRGLFETYEVQEGSVILAEYKDNDIYFTICEAGTIFTVAPKIPHNIYMMKDSVIHTVKHGEPIDNDSLDDKADWWDNIDSCKELEYLKNYTIDEIKQKIKKAKKQPDKSCIIVLDKRKHQFTKTYMHFDNLIWQLPIWILGLLTITIGITAKEVNAEVMANLPFTLSEIFAYIFIGFGIFSGIITWTMHRFRYHQLIDKEKQQADKKEDTQKVISPQILIQIFVNILVILFFVISLDLLGIWNLLLFGAATPALGVNKLLYLIFIIFAFILSILWEARLQNKVKNYKEKGIKSGS
ncbi:MAG: hypothetical protein FWD13_12685 [Treponema sp.]|nr:hypothetical protein [Treponema sp.]